MRYLAVIVSAALAFVLVAPAAFAQPFADVPTNHWAYDAIAELAAKGIVEGYPDGTFKGDRAMTRYEMAMVVARLLARIESIQVPAGPAPAPAPAPVPAAPPITRVDVETIQRLVNEFRAELAALGVRTTAIEEELNAIKTRLGNVKVTGMIRIRYDTQPTASGPSLNGNPNTGSIGSSSTPFPFRARGGAKLAFDGSVAPNVHAILGVAVASNISSTPLTFNSSNYGCPAPCSTNLSPTDTAARGGYVLADIYNLFFDWSKPFGLPLDLWIGRFGNCFCSPYGGHPVQFGPFGLLLNTQTSTWAASTANSGVNLVDGLRIAWHDPALLDLQAQGLLARVTGPVGASTYFLGEDVYGVDANVKLMPRLRVGASYVGNTINPASTGVAGAGPTPSAAPGSPLWHVYGNPGFPGKNPPTVNCPAVTGPPGGFNPVAGGITCAAAGSGPDVYVLWDVFPGVHFDGEWATWNDAVHSISDTGWQVNVTWDLGALLGAGHNLLLQTGYVTFGQNFYPPYGVEVDSAIASRIFPGNGQGFVGQIRFDVVRNLTLAGLVFTGNNISNGMSITEYDIKLTWRFAPRTSLLLRVENQTIGGVQQFQQYRAQMDYLF